MYLEDSHVPEGPVEGSMLHYVLPVLSLSREVQELTSSEMVEDPLPLFVSPSPSKFFSFYNPIIPTLL